jgi:hypothetical protein
MRTLLLSSCLTVLLSLGLPALVLADDCPAGQVQVCTDVGCGCVANGSGGTGTGGYQSGGTGTGNSAALINPLKSGTSLESFLANILSFVVRIGAIIVVLMLVYVGYLFVVAQGSDSKLTEARRALLWTVIGALVLLGAQAIASAIKATVTALGG